jgi:hypothetical protein
MFCKNKKIKNWNTNKHSDKNIKKIRLKKKSN